VSKRLRAVLEEADAFCPRHAVGKEGLLFLKNGEPVQPDPQDLSVYTEQAGTPWRLWPSSSEIGSAMLYREIKNPKP